MIIKNFINGQITTGTEPIDPISGVSRGLYINSVLSGNSSSDTLVGLDINPSYSGIAGNYFGLRVSGDTIFATSGGTQVFRTNNSGVAITGTLSNTTGAQFATSSGNVLIGTTTDAGFKLDVNGTGRFSGNVNIAGGSAATQRQILFQSQGIKIKHNTNGLGNNIVIGWDNDDLPIDSTTQRSTIIGFQNKGNIASGSVILGLTNFLDNYTGGANLIIGAGLVLNATTLGTGKYFGCEGLVGNAFNGMFALGTFEGFPKTTDNTGVIIGTGQNNQTFNNPTIFLGQFANDNTLPSSSRNNHVSTTNGVGTDVEGYNLILSTGKSTGAATPKDLIFATTTALSSGTTRQTLSPRWYIKGQTGTLSNVISPNDSASLQVDSTTKGFLGPRMTTTQRDAIVSPATGLQVFNTTLGTLDLYDGTGWDRFGSQTLIRGIGSTSSTFALLVQNSGNTVGFAVNDAGNTLIGLTGDTGFKLQVSGSTLLRGSGTTSASYALATQNSSGGTTMVVNNAGNMLIGTTTDAGFKLDVNGTGRFSNALTVGGSNANNVSSLNVLSTYGFLNLTSSVQNNQSTVWLKLQPTHVVGGSVGSIHIGGGNNSISSTSGNAQRNVLMTLSFVNELTSIGLTAIGWQAGYNVTSSSYSVMIGHNAGGSVTSGSNNVFIGDNAGNGIVGGTNNLHFAAGEQLTNGDFSNSIHFGSGRANTRSLTFGVGTTTGTYLNNVYFGAGFSTTNTLGGSGRGVTLQPTTESGKTDSSALNITLAGGIGTGAGTPGDVIISTATSGSTGSTLQTLTTRLVVKANTGNVGIGTSSPTNPLDIAFSPGRLISFQAVPGYADSGQIVFSNATSAGIVSSGTIGLGPGDTNKTVTLGNGIISKITTPGSTKYDCYGNQTPSTLAGTTNRPVLFTSTIADGCIDGFIFENTSSGSKNLFKVIQDNTTLLTLNPNGNFFLGTTTDLGFKLSVSGSTLLRGSGTTSASYALATQNSSGGTTMVVNNAGNMLIGTTTDAGYKLDVNGTARFSGAVTAGVNNGTFADIILDYNGGTRRIKAGANSLALTDSSGNRAFQLNGGGANPQIALEHDGVTFCRGQVSLQYSSSAIQQMVLTSSNYVGHLTPFFDIKATGYANSRNTDLRFYTDNTTSGVYGNIIIGHDGTTSTGNVLIGTSTTNNSRLLVGGTVSGATLSTTRAVHINPTLLATGNTTTLIGLDIQPTFTQGSFTGLTQIALRVSGGTQIIGSGSTGTTLSLFSVDGASGRLFDVTDDFTNSLFSVNTSSGVPVIEAFANNSIVMGTYGSNALVVSGTSVSVGTSTSNSTSVLNIVSTTKGVQFPRMTTAQKNSLTGAADILGGLVVFDTNTNKLCCYNGTTWNDLF